VLLPGIYLKENVAPKKNNHAGEFQGDESYCFEEAENPHEGYMLTPFLITGSKGFFTR
jgi:hypothetical protein